MKPTLEQVYNQARSLMGDDEVQGGEVFSDVVLAPHASQAIRELFRVLRGAQDPFVLTENYFVVPANTSIFDPATAGILNVPEPEFLEWTLPPAPVAITNVVVTQGDTPFATVTAPGHLLTIGTFPAVVIYGVQGFDQFNSPNADWTASIIDANTVQINGCTATGAYVADGFLVSVSPLNRFVSMSPVDRIEGIAVQGASPGGTASIYAWEGGVFHFLPTATNRLIRLTYRQSGMVNLSQTTVIPVDDCQDYLATRTAALAGASRGATARAAELNEEAIGPTGQADGSGGILRQMLATTIRNMQRIQYRYRPFRPNRQRDDYILY